MFFQRKWDFLCLIVLLTVIECVSQTPVPRTPRQVPDPNRQDPATVRWYEELRKRENAPTGIGSVIETQATLYAKLRSEALKKLKPSEDEKERFADFLSQPNTGLIKLGSETDCTKILDVANPDIDCLNHFVEGKARAYSFRKNRYSHQAYADLERFKGNFVVPGTYILGLMCLLGNIPIGSVTLDNENVAALLNFKPATEIDNIIAQEKQITKGLLLGNTTYWKALPIRENTTYLMRSVAYQAKFKNLPKSDKRKGSLDDDDRSDIIVVFRVVQKNPDDSLLLLWKELYRRNAPKTEVDMAN
jgi:hypothetical protein